MSNNRFALATLILYLLIWAALAIDPSYRHDWLLENLLVFIGVPFFVLLHFFLPLSRISYVLLFLFMSLHAVGAHYTYSEVPYDQWFAAFTGSTLNEMLGWERNHFDRLVHLCWGLLLAYPVREIFVRVADARGFWGYLFPLLVVISTSAIYELIEWGAAIRFGGDLGAAFLGTQGDIWDAHKDMALASLGSLVAIGITAGISASLNRDFAQEWADSLRIARREPLGEHQIRQWLEARHKEKSE